MPIRPQDSAVSDGPVEAAPDGPLLPDLRRPPRYAWVAAPVGAVSGRGIAVTPTGQIVIVGSYAGQASLGSHSLYHPASPLRPRAFVAALDKQGTFLWARGVSGVEASRATAVAVDAGGNLYVAGELAGPASFGSHALSSGELFVTKLDGNGTFLWAVGASSSEGQARVRGIAVTAAGSAHLTGSFSGSASFGARSATSQGSFDAFVARLDEQGTFLWASRWGAEQADHGVGLGLDAAGNSYALAQTAAGGGSQGKLSVLRLDGGGALAWASASDPTSGGTIEGLAIAVSPSGSSVITAAGQQVAKLGGVTFPAVGGKFGEGLIVAALDPKGSFLWARTSPGSISASGYDENKVRGLAVALEPGGASVVAGGFFGELTLGNELLSQGQDAFVTRLDPTGHWTWAIAGGGPGADQALGVALDSAGNAHVLGTFVAPAWFGETSLQTGSTFVARVSPQGSW